MDQPFFFQNWRDRIIFSAGGPQPQVLYEDGKIKVVVVGLEPGNKIPIHPGDAGVYHFLEGAGQMQVDENTFHVQSGSTVIVPAGSARGMTADTRLAFIAVRVA
jgi:quercetin dioxygenase-like cupin family protein